MTVSYGAEFNLVQIYLRIPRRSRFFHDDCSGLLEGAYRDEHALADHVVTVWEGEGPERTGGVDVDAV